MKKINIVVNFVGIRGGGISYAYEMVKSLIQNECDVFAIVSSKMENIKHWREIPHIQLFELKGYSSILNFFPNLLYFYFIEAQKIKKILLKKRIDFVYLPMSSYWAWFVQRVLKKYRTIFTLHDVNPHDNYKGFTWLMSNRLAKECDDLIILSDCFRQTVIERYHKHNDKVHTLPLGNQAYYISSSASTIPIIYNSNNFNFLFYGRIVEYKGLDILAVAFNKILEKYENVSLTIVGQGDFSPYEKLYQCIKSDKIRIENRWIGDEEVSHFFNGDKIITLLPYKNATQSGVIPIAMNMHSLVIATRCSGLSEQIVNGETGYLIEPNSVESLVEKMIFVIENWDSMKPIIENAYEYIQSQSWEMIARELIKKL